MSSFFSVLVRFSSEHAPLLPVVVVGNFHVNHREPPVLPYNLKKHAPLALFRTTTPQARVVVRKKGVRGGVRWWQRGGGGATGDRHLAHAHDTRARVYCVLCTVVQWAAGDVAAFAAFARPLLLKMTNRNGKRKRETETRSRSVLLWRVAVTAQSADSGRV